MPNPATAGDIESRWRPLTTDEAIVGTTLLEDGWLLLKGRVVDLEDRMDDEADLPAAVKRVLANAVIRVMKNPDGKRQESIDDYSWTRDNAVSAGELYFTDAEMASLIPGGSVRGGAFTVDTLSPVATLPTQVVAPDLDWT